MQSTLRYISIFQLFFSNREIKANYYFVTALSSVALVFSIYIASEREDFQLFSGPEIKKFNQVYTKLQLL